MGSPARSQGRSRALARLDDFSFPTRHSNPLHDSFSATHFLGTASGEFLRPAASRLLLSRFLPKIIGSLPECGHSPWEQQPSLWVPQENGAKKGEKNMYLNSVTLVGFVGADPEQRQAKGNGTKFTVLSVATQRSWKNAEDAKTEWHQVAIFRTRLAQYIFDNVKKGSHVLVEGSLISSIYEQAGKGKKAASTKVTSWSIRADAVRRLDRGEPEPQAIASRSSAAEEASETSSEAPN
jgi:single-strand DNA-binding protein